MTDLRLSRVLRRPNIVPKEKISKLNLKISKTNLCSAKTPIKRIKRQPTDFEEIFENPVSDKGLVFRLYKELSKLWNKITKKSN